MYTLLIQTGVVWARGGRGSRTQSEQLRVSEGMGLGSQLKSQHHCEGPGRRWDPGRKTRRADRAREGRRFNEEGGGV